MNQDSYIGFFSNFTSPSRLTIVLALASGPLTVGQICKRTGIEQSNVSHHLSILSNCNLVSFTQDGKHRLYSANTSTLFPLLHIAQKHTGGCPDSCKRECVVR